MNISVLVISICCGLILLSIISCMMNPLFRLPKEKEEEDMDGEPRVLPPLSVIVTIHDNADTLERNLPLFLAQEYEPGFQIIIVANEGDSLADDVIKRFKDKKNIQSTFIPKSSFYVSREKLGVTLGVKAAKNDWCVLVDDLCYPESNHWLEEIGKECTDDRNIVIGYCNFADDAKAFHRFARMRHFAYLWREAVKGIPYSANYANLAFRKKDFIADDGYRGNLECVRGEYDFIINKYARKEKTGIVTSAEGSLTEVAPSDSLWHKRQIFYHHSTKLMKHGFCHKALGFIDSLLLHLTWISSLALGTLAALMQNWFILGAAIIALIISIVWRTITGKVAMNKLHVEISPAATVWFELTSIWHTLSNKIRYRRADKYDFTCHKL